MGIRWGAALPGPWATHPGHLTEASLIPHQSFHCATRKGLLVPNPSITQEKRRPISSPAPVPHFSLLRIPMFWTLAFVRDSLKENIF